MSTPVLPLPTMPRDVTLRSAEGRAARRSAEHDERLGWWICSSPLVIPGAVLIFAGADRIKSDTNFGSVTALGLAVGAAALISGVFVGFLFGLPTTLRQDKPKGLLATNTSLDQITDWLTKILVGLGLVQLGKIGHGVSKISDSLGPGLGGGPGATAFATALLVYGAADGFLIGYLWTRIVLSKRFDAAARALEVVEQADSVLGGPPPAPPRPPEKPTVAAAAAPQQELGQGGA